MKKLNTFINNLSELKFGDYILFQEYKQDRYDKDNKQYIIKVSKPILVIYLGYFVADQTVGFNYIRWNNDNHMVYNKTFPTLKDVKEVEEIQNHIEWNDYIDILGHWKNKPNWKEIISYYRNQELKEEIGENEINWKD